MSPRVSVWPPAVWRQPSDVSETETAGECPEGLGARDPVGDAPQGTARAATTCPARTCGGEALQGVQGTRLGREVPLLGPTVWDASGEGEQTRPPLPAPGPTLQAAGADSVFLTRTTRQFFVAMLFPRKPTCFVPEHLHAALRTSGRPVSLFYVIYKARQKPCRLGRGRPSSAESSFLLPPL